jgi:sugar O-acyltransferase (sialic acid O-acetyltransferase NeuD family)
MKKIIIIGAGSVGGHIANNLDLYGIAGHLVGFLDDDINKQGKDCFGYPVLGPVSWILDQHDFDVVIGIAFPKIKEKIINALALNPELSYPTLIAKNAWISNNTEIGKGTIIYPGTCINYGSVIKDFVVVNMNCSIGHDCTIASFCSLAPGVNLGGHTKVQKLTELGIGVSTVQGTAIGKNSVIGGQTMVTKDIPDGVTAIGVPVKIKSNESVSQEF